MILHAYIQTAIRRGEKNLHRFSVSPVRSRNCCILIRTRYYFHRYPVRPLTRLALPSPGQFVSPGKIGVGGYYSIRYSMDISSPNQVIVHM